MQISHPIPLFVYYNPHSMAPFFHNFNIKVQIFCNLHVHLKKKMSTFSLIQKVVVLYTSPQTKDMIIVKGHPLHISRMDLGWTVEKAEVAAIRQQIMWRYRSSQAPSYA